MSRIASIYFPLWSIERLLKAQGPQKARLSELEPLALVTAETGGLRITAVNRQAHALGIARGELLTDARARLPNLQSYTAKPDKDAQGLIRLARWMTRFTPWAAPWPEDWEGSGLSLDITGSSHLAGGEEPLSTLILDRLHDFGLTARIAIAETAGAAYALARYGPAERVVVPQHKTAEAVRALPVEALRISEDTASSLKHLGLKHVGDLTPLPRGPLTARFGAALLERLDQILGRAPEPISPLAAAPAYRATARLAEPICLEDHILTVLRHLIQDLLRTLERDGKGARNLRLMFYRVDGEVAAIEIGLAQPSRAPAHIEKLFALRLETLRDDLDVGFGYDAASLEASVAEPIAQLPHRFEEDRADNPGERISVLIDRLGTRLGIENVRRLYPHQTHIPERAVVARPAMQFPPGDWTSKAETPLRPLLMLPAAEPAEVIAPLPEGPPRQFRWRGVRYAVAYAEGPERIRPEWWWRDRGTTRDYYILEDEEGRRFWLYRKGLYGKGPEPRWFVHGVFA